ncbi:MAG: sugar phosphate isomerase/epimerase [Candidatus Hydrogenedentes bacterium]|nr:sugar phosphate isomerase/epimerase [Candidatus Hydrogenedentota bacterium]
MSMDNSRRDFLKQAGAATLALGAMTQGGSIAMAAPAKRTYGVSVAAWSLHRTIGEGDGKTPMLDMPKLVREQWDIEAIELVNKMLASTDQAYLEQLKKNAADHNVKILLIMIDGEGNIGDKSEKEIEKAIAGHKKWIDIASFFGCHSVRMNWAGAPKNWEKNEEELNAFIERSAPGFRTLCDYADTKGMFVIIENHGGPSSNPAMVDKLMAAVKHPRFGTLPDFGNFPEGTDIYAGIDSLMKHAHLAVSAKCYDFDPATGLHTDHPKEVDFEKMLQIVCDKHGYTGYIGIEYEGDKMPEFDGIAAANALLIKLRG